MNFSRFSLQSCLFGFAAGVLCTGVVATTTAQLSASVRFPDVELNAYYDEPVARMYNAGVIGGYDNGNFGPNDFVTRGQLAVMFNRFEKYLAGQFTGVSVRSPIVEGERTTSAESSSSEITSSFVPTASSSTSRRRTVSSSSSSVSSSSSTVATTGAKQAVTRNNAGVLEFSITDFSISEGSASAKVSVFRTGGSDGRVVLTFSTKDVSATTGDDYFGNTNNTIAFQDGTTNQTIEINLLDDEVYEGPESFEIHLVSASNGAGIGESHTATVNIIDNEPVPEGGDPNISSSSSSTNSATSSTSTAAGGIIDFSAAGYTFPENTGTATITIVRSGETGSTATVEYETQDGSADAGSEYTATSGSVSFASGETSKTFTVNLTENTTIGGNKKFTVRLKNVSAGAVLGDVSSAEVIIADDDMSTYRYQAGEFTFAEDVYSGSEATEKAIVTVNRIGGAQGEASVTFETNPLSAASGTDFEAVNTTLTFKDGESSKVVVIKIINDNVSDSSESFKVKISNPTNGATMGSDTLSTVEISEN